MTIQQQRPTGGCTNCGHPVRTRKSNGWVCAKCERDLNRPTLTVEHIESAYANPEWMGFGYLGERQHQRRTLQDRGDAYVLYEANKRHWTAEQLFAWLNSRDGRHYGDYVFSLPTRYNEAEAAHAAESYFRGW